MSKTGTVKNWNEEKGFGFIGPDDGGEDLFCHRSALVGAEALEKGDKVTFDETYDERKGKMRANNVTPGNGGGGGGCGGGGHGGGGGYESRRDSGRDTGRDSGRDSRRDSGYGRDSGRDGGRDGGRDSGRSNGYSDRGRSDYDRRERSPPRKPEKIEKFGGRNRGDDISEGGNRHVTARELYMNSLKGGSSGGRRGSDSRSPPPRSRREGRNFA